MEKIVPEFSEHLTTSRHDFISRVVVVVVVSTGKSSLSWVMYTFVYMVPFLENNCAPPSLLIALCTHFWRSRIVKCIHVNVLYGRFLSSPHIDIFSFALSIYIYISFSFLFLCSMQEKFSKYLYKTWTICRVEFCSLVELDMRVLKISICVFGLHIHLSTIFRVCNLFTHEKHACENANREKRRVCGFRKKKMKKRRESA